MLTGVDNLGLFIAAGVLLNLTHSLKTGWRTKAAASAESFFDASASEVAINSIASYAIRTRATGKNHLKQVFVKGFCTNVLNPKIALFILAFVPRFIAPHAQHKTAVFLLPGLLFNFSSLWINLGYAALGAAVSRRFAALQNGRGGRKRLADTLFIGFGLKLALTDNPPH